MSTNNAKESIKKILEDVKDESSSFDKKEIESGKAMALLSYIGILCLIPYFVEKNNKYVRFHAVQGINLAIIEGVYFIFYGIITSIIKVKSCEYFFGYPSCTYVTPWWLTLLLGIVGLSFTALAILGIVNSLNGKAKELPVVNKFKIIKK